MNPNEANARLVLGKLSSEKIVELANEWLETGIYSESLGELCTMKTPMMSDVGPLFSSAMKELGIPVIGKKEAAVLLTQSVLRRVSDGCSNPVEEAEFLYWDVHHQILNEAPDRKHVGDNLGLEYLFCWLREIWDCRDGSMILYHTELPRAEAEVKFIEHLREAAADWMDRNTQQGGGGNSAALRASP